MADASKKPPSAASDLKQKAMEKVQDLAQTRNWYSDRYERIAVQRNVLLIVAFVMIGLMGLSVLSVSELNDRKVFEPFVIQVEDKSGIVTQVTQKNYERYTTDEAIIRYFINKYLSAREEFHPATYRHEYETVTRLLSNAQTYAQFSEQLSLNSADSPLRLGQEIKRELFIKSMTFLDDAKRKAQIRINTRDVQIAGRGVGDVVSEGHFIVTMTYEFVRLDLPQDARYINPLGFQVTNYVRERESVR